MSNIITNFQQFINESIKNDDVLIEQIKKSLVMENLVDEDEFNELYNGDLDLAWKNFVDNQVNGDCQGIVASIIFDFKNVKKVFGEIEVDEPYLDEDDEEQTLMTHHWITINGKIYDFSKGTLKNYIDWEDVYDVEVEGDEWRYN
jgi:mRNA-degrading endonuclease YafQ of YafQ-DinJ toxin-antitoxin module